MSAPPRRPASSHSPSRWSSRAGHGGRHGPVTGRDHTDRPAEPRTVQAATQGAATARRLHALHSTRVSPRLVLCPLFSSLLFSSLLFSSLLFSSLLLSSLLLSSLLFSSLLFSSLLFSSRVLSGRPCQKRSGSLSATTSSRGWTAAGSDTTKLVDVCRYVRIIFATAVSKQV